MNPLGLLDTLKTEMEVVLENVYAVSGKFKVYTQTIPPVKREEDQDPRFPLCHIQLGDGEEDDEKATQDVVIILGVYDSTPDLQGHRDVANAVQAIRTRFRENPYLDAFRLRETIKWVLPLDGDTHPKYFGAVLMTFDIPPIQAVWEYT